MEKWEKLMEEYTCEMMNDDESAKRFMSSDVVRMAACIPFLAGCSQAERTALGLMSMLHAASKIKEPANHTAEDDKDPLERLKLLDRFIGGDRSVIEKGLTGLACFMLEGYKSDIDRDKAQNKYNPVGAGAWYYLKTKEKLTKKFKSVKQDYMDSVMERATVTAKGVWWQV
jgi:hypothetical protein